MTDETPIQSEQAPLHESIGAPSADAPETPQADPPTREAVIEALRTVLDPEIGLPIVDLGLVYDVEVDADGVVKVTYTLTSLGCPVGPMIEHQMQQIVTSFPGVTAIESNLTFTPPWSPEKMTEEAKAALGMF